MWYLVPATRLPVRGSAPAWRGYGPTKSLEHQCLDYAKNDRRLLSLPTHDTPSEYSQRVARSAALRAAPGALYAGHHASGTPPTLPLPSRSSLRSSPW